MSAAGRHIRRGYEVEKLSCLDFGSGECVGDVELSLAQPVRYRTNGEFIMFPRCEKHWDEYADRAQARQERQWAAERAERDEWANFE
jgi:hypothetical protein